MRSATAAGPARPLSPYPGAGLATAICANGVVATDALDGGILSEWRRGLAGFGLLTMPRSLRPADRASAA